LQPKVNKFSPVGVNLEHKNEQNRGTSARILPTDTDKISAVQESREIKEELKRLAPDVQINEDTSCSGATTQLLMFSIA